MIIRARRNTNYTMMSNVGLNDSRLSWKARGMLAYLLSKPDYWQVSDRHLATVGPDGRDACQSALKELEECCYLVRNKVRNVDGTFGWQSIIYDEPWMEKPATVQPATDNSATDKPAKVSTLLVSTDGVSTERENTVDVSSSRKRGGGKAKEEVNPNTKPILDAYVEELGYEPDNYAAEGKAAKRAAKKGYMPDDIRAAYQLIKAQPFWQAKNLSLSKVVTEIPALQQAHLKGVLPNGNGKVVDKAGAAANELRAMLRAHGMEGVLRG